MVVTLMVGMLSFNESLIFLNLEKYYFLIPFVPYIRFSVGSDSSIRLWKDLWWGDHLTPSPFGTSWNFPFSRDLYDREVDLLANLMLCLKEVFMSNAFHDQRVWVLESSGVYSLRSFFLSLTSSTILPSSFPSAKI